MIAEHSTIDPKEVAHFAKDSARWWDENGPFRPLHRLNPVRIGYIRDQICAHYTGHDPDSLQSLAGLSILDAGCGGGLVCEPLSRMGAAVTGIDADESAISAAAAHAAESGLDITYRHAATGDLVADKAQYDVVLALEIIEHVSDPEQFARECFALCKPGGLVIFSTLNRTAKSFALGIVAAEYILRWVPAGTHQWKKFIRPAELARLIRQAGGRQKDKKGLIYNPISSEFKLSDKDIDVNYFMSAEKI